MSINNVSIDFVVTVVEKKVKNRYKGYSITIPTKISRALGLKGGEKLLVRVIDIEINGKKVRGILYYSPKLRSSSSN
ncbi:MAG: hypothetical protein QW611_03945 [Ignisphaera sp.]